MSKDYTKELAQMEHLMNYGMNESKKSTDSKGIIEYSQMGADGKTYGIIREGTKYFVKVAPKKDTQIVAEDYDYVNGFLNRKSYDSYTKASNALNLHLISVNESNDNKKPVKSQFNLNESAEWQNSQTKEAREELNRFYQIVGNVDSILNENVHYIKENDTKKPYDTSVKDVVNKANKGGNGNNGTPGSPDQGLGNGDKTFVDGEKKNAESMQKKYEKGDMGKSGFGDHNIDNEGGNAYQEKAKTSKEQGKTVANESKKRVIKLSEEQKKQVLAWRDDRAFVHQSSDSELDRSHGTEIGDTAPYDDKVNENFETSEWDEGLPGSAGIGDPKGYKEPFDKQDGVRQPVTENVFEVEFGDDEFGDNELELGDMGSSDDPTLDSIPDDEAGFGSDSTSNFVDREGVDLGGEYGDNVDLDDVHNVLGSETDDEMDANIDDYLRKYGEGDDALGFNQNETLEEAVKRIVETTLNDFGKHPAYQKKVMTLPPNADGSQWGEDWNDESTKGEQPYGKQIGHSGDPFEDVVDAITNAVVTALGKKKD